MKKTILAAAFAALGTSGAHAVLISNFGAAVTQNFDSMSTGTALPTDWKMTAAGDTTVSWTDSANVTTVTQTANSGAPTQGGRYNWGQTASDRAIGFMTSGSYANPNSIMSMFTNNTGGTIASLDLAFDYERFRVNTSAASATFFYSLNGTTWTAATAGNSGAFSTGASSYTFASPTRVSKSFSITGLSIADGSDVFFRWNIDTTGTNSQGVGLDNFSLTAAAAVPEPSTFALIGLGLGALFILRRGQFRNLAK